MAKKNLDPDIGVERFDKELKHQLKKFVARHQHGDKLPLNEWWDLFEKHMDQEAEPGDLAHDGLDEEDDGDG